MTRGAWKRFGDFLRKFGLRPWQVIVALWVLCFLIFGQNPSPPPLAASSPTAATESPKPAVEELKAAPVLDVDLVKLQSDYRENEVREDARFKGQWIRFRATVGRIETNFLDQPSMVVFPSGLRCEFDKKESLVPLRSGQTVIITGVCNGLFLRDVRIEHCMVDPVN